MQNYKTACVVTTIQLPTACLVSFTKRLAGFQIPMLAIGDETSPPGFSLSGCTFVSLSDQQRMDFTLSKLLPVRHYSRKNLGYLIAMMSGAECIYETDDDNRPNDTWTPRNATVSAWRANPAEWVNVYRYFTEEVIWPRGYPLNSIRDSLEGEVILQGLAEPADAPIQQGLADGSPDVDAIWRLLFDRQIEFNGRRSIFVPQSCWCPFNSQSTWWWPPTYPLLYLPSFCSFRATDIWRSFIAQRCLWEMGHELVFHPPEVLQERNFHDLTKDFEAEIAVYTQGNKLARRLADVKLNAGKGSALDNLVRCYEALSGEFFPEKELALVRAWADDIRNIGQHTSPAGEFPAL
jgi:hypothetical protein